MPSLPLSPFGAALRRLGREPSAAEAFVERLAERAEERFDLPAGMVTLTWEAVGRSAEPLEARQGWLLLGALLLAAQREGSTRIPVLAEAGEAYLRDRLEALFGGGGEAQAWRERLAQLLADPGPAWLVGGAEGRGLFVLEGGFLAARRERERELSLAGALRARAQAAAAPAPSPAELEAALSAVASSAPVALSEEQQQAIRAACRGSLTLVSGGPGTGKTSIVVSLLRTLARLGFAPEEIALAAPTGKAAKRLSASIQAALEATPAAAADEALRGDLPAARTLHRLLGYSPGRRAFRHDRRRPLAARVVVVDETSMVDQALMARLLAALPAGARLILLGDHRQLPSVGAGAVLRDVLSATAAAGSPLAGCGVRLTQSFRQSGADPRGAAILDLAEAIDAGRPLAGSLSERADPDELAFAGAELLPSAQDEAGLERFLARWHRSLLDAPRFREAAQRSFRVDQGQVSAQGEPLLRALLELHERAQLLTLTRVHPTGSLALNRRLQALTRAACGGVGAFAPGDKVIVTVNDYERGLFNGDLGAVIRVRGARGGRPVAMAAFEQRGELRLYPLAALQHQLELAYALTVHKSQGSEYERCAIVLPRQPVGLLTRAILYTGVTRARASVVVAGSPAILSAGATQAGRRWSGLEPLLVEGTESVSGTGEIAERSG